VAVVDLGRVSPAALAVATPRVLLRIVSETPPPILTAPSPRTRIGVVLTAAGTDDVPAPGDVVWRGAGPGACAALAAALPRLLALADRRGAP